MMRAKAPRPPIAGMLALFLLAQTRKVEGEAWKRRLMVKAGASRCLARIPLDAYGIAMSISDFSGKTIAIDFETATEARASACSIGLAFIENGRVVRIEERLIRPPDNRYSPFNVAIHGIRPEHTAHAPDFADVMAEFAGEFEGARMIAHNASFDFSVLRACLDLVGLEYPELSYLCSVKLAQRHWPDLGSHRLNVLAAHLGLTFAHHNAAEDARICAEACLAMAVEAEALDCFDLALKLGLNVGRLNRRGYEPCSFARKPRRVASLQA